MPPNQPLARYSTFPQPSRQPISVDYLENRRPDIHSGELYDVSAQRFVEQRWRQGTRQWQQGPISFDLVALDNNDKALAERTTAFHVAVAKLKKEKSSEKKISTFKFETAGSWQDVITVVDDAQKTYLRTESVSEKIRGAFRKVGDNAKAIQPFIGLLPDGEYKTLCGGLTLIVGAMVTHSEIREKMADLLDQVPDYVQLCQNYAKIYPGKNTLLYLGQELYINLLRALEDIVKWYTQGSLKRAAKGFVQGPVFAQSIDNHIKAIKTWRDRLRDAADQFLHGRVAMVDATVVATSITATQIKEDTTFLRKAIDKGGHAVEQLRDELSSVKVDVLNGFKDMLDVSVSNAEWKKEHMEREKEKERIIQQQASEMQQQASAMEQLQEELKRAKAQLKDKSFTSEVLAQRLALPFPDTLHTDDVNRVLKDGTGNTLDFQGRSRSVAQATQCQTWLRCAESKVLFINGSSDQEPISPLSFYAGLLIDKLQSTDHVLVLSFFCGLHRGKSSHSKDGSSPILPLLKSLLAQLLAADKILESQQDPSTSCLYFLNEAHVVELAEDSMEQYMMVISSLLRSAKSLFAATFVVLDGIDYYDKRWRGEIKSLLQELVSLASEEAEASGSGALKVMGLASARSVLFRQCKSGDHTLLLDMPEEIDGDDNGFDRRNFRRMESAGS